MVANAALAQVYFQKPQVKALSWEERIAFGHTPSRRDCRVCQQDRQQCNPRKRFSHPLAGALSLDTAGPLHPAMDQGGHLSRYFLAASFTWAIPKGYKKEEEEETEEKSEDEEEYPQIEGKKLTSGRSEPPGWVESRVTKFRPLRMDGYHVNHIHTDQGHEFAGHFTTWRRSRGIMLTKTCCESNGRAKATVKRVKTMIRKALYHGGQGSKMWPWACRCVNEVLRCHPVQEA